MLMTRWTLYLRTFAWAAVGFFATDGVFTAIMDALEIGDWSTGVKRLTLASIAALATGVIAVIQSLRYSTDTSLGKAINQFLQMLLAGLATLAVADLTGAAVVAFGTAFWKLIVAALIGAAQAYFVNLGEVRSVS